MNLPAELATGDIALESFNDLLVLITGSETGATMGMNLLIMALVALGAAAIHFLSVTPAQHIQDLAAAADKAAQKVQDLANSMKQITDLGTQYQSLITQQNTAGLSADDTQKLYDVSNQLATLIPELVVGYDDLGNAILKSSAAMGDLTGTTLDHMKAAAADAKQAADNSLKGGAKDLQEQLNVLQGSQGIWSWGYTDKQKAEFQTSYQDSLSTMEEAFKKAGHDSQEAFISTLTDPALRKVFQGMLNDQLVAETAANVAKLQAEFNKLHGIKVTLDASAFGRQAAELHAKISDLASLQKDLMTGTVTEAELAKAANLGLDVVLNQQTGQYELTAASLKKYVDGLKDELSTTYDLTTEQQAYIQGEIDSAEASAGQAKAVGDMLTAFETHQQLLADAYAQQQKDGGLTIDNLLKLIDAGYATAISIDAVTGKMTLNAEVARACAAAEIMKAQSTAYVAWAAAAVVDPLSQETAALWEEYQAIVSIGAALAKVPAGGFTMKAPSGGGGGSAPTADAYYKLVESYIKKQKDDEKAALQARIDGMKTIIDAEKKAIDLKEQEITYQEELNNKEKDQSKIQMQLDALALDNSAEAKAKRVKLEDDLAKSKTDIAKTQRTHQITEEKAALDQELADFTATIKPMIDAIDKYLAEPGRMMQDAIAMAKSGGQDLYNKLIEWNGIYGSGIENDVVKAWKDAQAAWNNYKNAVGSGTGGGGSYVPSTKPSTPATPPPAMRPEDYYREPYEVYTPVRPANYYQTPACFIAGTKISMADGTFKNIEDMQIGDLVLSYNTNSQLIFPAEIIKTFKHENSKGYYLLNDFLGVTGEHPLYVNSKWVLAEDIKLGDMLFSKSGEFVEITRIEKILDDCPVYNLSTGSETHNYFVNGILAHNKSEGGKVGGGEEGKDSVPAMLMPGEFVIKKTAADALGNNMLNIMNSASSGKSAALLGKNLSSMANAGYTGGATPKSVSSDWKVDNLLTFNVTGNLDKTVVPDIQRLTNDVVDKLMKHMYSRGVLRSADKYSF